MTTFIPPSFLGVAPVRRTLLAVVLLAIVVMGGVRADKLEPYRVADEFESGMNRWQTTDVNSSFWKIIALENGGHALRVTGKSDYQPPHRSPHSIAWLKDTHWGDFELTVRAQSTDNESGDHRDLCIFWGYQHPAHFYYVHFGAKADPHACQIFIVNDAPRLAITVDEAAGTPWTDGWHELRVIRRVDDGSMEVYFDDRKKPLMTARDKTFTWGQVGLGTFDNHGNWDDFSVAGRKVDVVRD